ncbi:MAG TPA: hypothetical protein VFB66_09220, partial [Tepidisphaeraceae bacterium]|nr:hypothetical protein [Tepidisphaeraceae bacterium]
GRAARGSPGAGVGAAAGAGPPWTVRGVRLRPAGDAGAVPGVRGNLWCRVMMRRLFHLLTLLSLLLCVAVAALWVRSHWRIECAGRFRSTRFEEVVSTRGMVSVRVTTYARPVRRTAEELSFRVWPGPPNLSLISPSAGPLSGLGFGY